MTSRPMCKSCGRRYAAVNYRDKKGTLHYRSKCDSCIRLNKGLRPTPATWQKAGYKKKAVCDKCRFRSSTEKQMIVYYVDGNMKNGNWNNLKTVCFNCHIELSENASIGWVTDNPLPKDF